MQRVRDMSGAYYGSIFYDGNELLIVDQYVKDQIPVLLAINQIGLHTFRKPPGWNTGKVSKGIPAQNILIRTNKFTEIHGWAAHEQSHTFIYTVPTNINSNTNTNTNEKKAQVVSPEGDGLVRFTFESPLAVEIPDVCDRFVKLMMSA